jgi:hypothetical protein
MYLDDATTTPSVMEVASTTLATSTDIVASSTQVLEVASEEIATTTNIEGSFSNATTSEEVSTSTASTTPIITPVIPKNKWFKLQKKEQFSALSGLELVEEIKKADKEGLEEKEKQDRLPDFAKDLIKKIKGALLNAVIIQVEKEGKDELWLYDLTTGHQSKIESGSSTAITIAKDMQLGLKDNHIFWLSEDRTKVYAYDLLTTSIISKEIPPLDSSIGERGRVIFEGVAWEVIIGSEEFAFYSEATGEVFSDDNGNLTEALRQKLELDKVLDVEAISGLNFSVTATGTTDE